MPARRKRPPSRAIRAPTWRFAARWRRWPPKFARSMAAGRGYRARRPLARRASLPRSTARAAGMMVTYGNASGPVALFSPLELARRGSLFLTCPTLFHYTDTVEALRGSTARLFDMIASGRVKISIGLTMPLAEATRGASPARSAADHRIDRPAALKGSRTRFSRSTGRHPHGDR